jgi:integrase
MSRRAKGEGTIYLRKDGRYEAATYLMTTTGIVRRVRFYGKTRKDVHRQLTEAKALAQQGVPIPDRAWKLGDYLDYWLEQIVKPSCRPKTYETYELRVRRHLKPHLGSYYLDRLTVPIVQNFLNEQHAKGNSACTVQQTRRVLRAALFQAMREELVGRNVAQLVKPPKWEPSEIRPWTVEESNQFLAVARSNPLYPAYLLLLLYGLRRGEVLGLRWSDIDVPGRIVHVRQQLQRVAGELHQGPVKTKAGRRELPLLNVASDALLAIRNDQDDHGLVFTTANGRPIEPNNFARSFQRLCRQHCLRIIKMHHLRHTAATLLKKLGVPARDAQLILGHSQIAVTQEIYQHADMGTRREALERMEGALSAVNQNDGSWAGDKPSHKPSLGSLIGVVDWIISGGPTGARTQDTLLKSSTREGVIDRATSIKRHVQCRARTWMLGSAAVNISRQDEVAPSALEAA